jgi:hypothetical protein
MTLWCKDRLSYTAALLVYPDMVHDVKWHNTLSRLDIFLFKTKHDRDFRILLCIEGHPAEEAQVLKVFVKNLHFNLLDEILYNVKTVLFILIQMVQETDMSQHFLQCDEWMML